MYQFQSAGQGRVFIHVMPTDRFKTRQIGVRLLRSMDKAKLTATAVLPYLWMDGTEAYPSAQALMRRADELYGTVLRTGIGKRGDKHIVEAFATVPEESALQGTPALFEDAWRLVLQLMAEPFLEDGAFPTANVDKEKALHRKRIESVFDDKMAYAMERCLEVLSRGELVGLPRLGYADELAALSGAQLWQTHQAILNEAEIHVYAVGKFPSTSAVADMILEHVASRLAGSTTARPSALPPVEPLKPTDSDQTQTVMDKQDVNQGKLNIGFRTGIPYRHSDYPALLVCNGILGGFPHSKLFMNVREKHSLAYYASSRLDALTGVIAVQTGIEMDKYEQTLEIVLEQIRALQAGDISEQEMIFTQRGIRNQYLQAGDQPISMVDIHFSGIVGGATRSLDELIRALEQVKKEDVIRVAQAIRLDTVYFLTNKEVVARA